MNVTLKLTDLHDAYIIKNLWPLYQHDVSEFDAGKPNRHGLFGAEDRVMTLAQHSESLNSWWSDPSALFPYLILADGHPAGFNLIASRPRLPSTIEADFVVHEFFVLHAFRGEGVGEKAAMDGFDLHKGKWEVVTYPNHGRGIAFWRRVINRTAKAGYSEGEMDHPWGRRVVFRFDNTEIASTARIDADG
jgi:predicted acetyltransferase